jgi:zinc protease
MACFGRIRLGKALSGLSILVMLGASSCSGVAPVPPPAPAQPPLSASAAPSAPPAPSRESPPEAGPATPEPFPLVRRDRLPNGLELELVPNHALPIVQLRLVLRSGYSRDGAKPGLARMTAHMLKDGGAGSMTSRQLIDRIESLGTELEERTGPDSTVLSLAVTASHSAEALDLLSTVARSPRWDAAEFRKLRQREAERAADLARSSGSWLARMALFRSLYRARTGRHPYAAPDATADEVRRIALGDCREFYRLNFVPKNARLVVAGDVDPDRFRSVVDRALGAWQGPSAAPVDDTDELAVDQLTLVLVNRPKSTQSDILAGALGPARSDASWTKLAVANQVLGGGVSGRLFLDVREQQSLAYATNSTLEEFGHGAAPLLLYAGTQTAKTGLTVQALLGHVARMAEAPSAREVEMARRYLADVFAVRMATIGNVADMVVNLGVLGLPHDYYDVYRRELGAVGASDVAPVAGRYYRPGHLVVAVAGDAARLGPVLAHFGQVTVLDPARGFERARVIPQDPNAPLELEQEPLQ